ncbi:dopamine receptor 4-like isoform X2 [Convolutriloba macropyga]|uniref:dopamine receptor 4-like isoform X2 n=1 Tax=Convolutriloba macropyga TaxID=536237 RepID=UPI003F527059
MRNSHLCHSKTYDLNSKTGHPVSSSCKTELRNSFYCVVNAITSPYQSSLNIRPWSMVGLVVAPIAGVVHILQGRWVFGYWMCHVWHAFDVLASTASILNLTAISLDRYIAIRKSLDYSTIVTHASCIAAITLVWLLSTVISFPAIVVWHFSLTSSEDSDVSYDARVCEFTNNRVYRITSSLISFYLPLCLMTFAYISVYMKAQQQLRVLASGNLLIKSNSGGASKSDGRGNSGKSGNKTSATVESSSENVTALRVHRGGGGANAKWNTFDTNGNLSAFSGASRHSYKSTNNPRGTPTASSMRSPTRTHQGITRSPSAHCRPSSGVMTYSKGGCSYVGVPMVTTTDVGGKTSCRLGAFLRERKATKTLGIVFGVFILCWLPFFTFNVVQAFTNRSFQYEIQLFDFFTLLGYANSCLNPFIYAATNVRFRLAFMRIIGCKRHRGDRDFAGLTTLGGTNHH